MQYQNELKLNFDVMNVIIDFVHPVPKTFQQMKIKVWGTHAHQHAKESDIQQIIDYMIITKTILLDDTLSKRNGAITTWLRNPKLSHKVLNKVA